MLPNIYIKFDYNEVYKEKITRKNCKNQNMETLTVNQIVEKVKTFLQKTYQDNLDQVILFGSRARGDHHTDSDVDILIVLKKPFNYSQEVEKTSVFISELSLEFDLVISRVFAETQDFNSKNTPFFMNVRKEGIIL
jgi:uncharacterized protein